MFLLGSFLLHINKKEAPKLSLNKTENLIFKLSKKLNSSEKNRRYEVEFYKENIISKSVLSIPKNQLELNFNHYYKGEVSIKKTEKAYADFVFNYQKYLTRKDIFYEAYLPGKISESSTKTLSFLELVKNERLKLLNRIDHSSLNEKSASFLKGIILADRTEMDSETISDFQKSGLMHLLAISGTHIGIIFGIFYFILTHIFSGKKRFAAIIASIFLIWAFAVFIGLGNSVIRACIMISVYFIYVLLQRKPDLLHALSLAALFILIANPQQIFDVGFQLSFSAVLGIYWLYKPILKLIPRSKFKAFNFFSSVLAITITAQISTLPLVIFYFHQFSFVSIIANMIVIPFAEIVIAFSLFLTVILSLNVDLSWLNSFYDVVISNLLKLINWFANSDFAMHDNISLKLLEVGLLFVALFLLRFFIVNFRWQTIFNLAVVLVIFTFVRLFINYQQHNLDETLTHKYFGRKILSIKNKERIVFMVPDSLDSLKIQKYVIKPYLVETRSDKYLLKVFSRNIKTVVINNKNYPVN